MDVSFLVFTVTLHSSYPFSPFTSSPLLTAHRVYLVFQDHFTPLFVASAKPVLISIGLVNLFLTFSQCLLSPA